MTFRLAARGANSHTGLAPLAEGQQTKRKARMKKFDEMMKDAVAKMEALTRQTIDNTRKGMCDALAYALKHATNCGEKAQAIMIMDMWMWSYCEKWYHEGQENEAKLGGVGAVVGTAALLWAAMRGQNNNNGGDSGDKCVTRYELGLVQENNALRATVAKLESQIYTDAKFEAVSTTVGALNMAQQRINDNVQAMISHLANQASTFAGLTQTILSPRAIAPAEAILASFKANGTSAASETPAADNGAKKAA